MKNIIAITERELKSYFASPIAYIVTAIFLIVSGYFFFFIISFSSLYGSDVNMQPVFYNMQVIMLFIAPVLTMRLLSEEKKTGTFELLVTSPVTEIDIVLGKYFASVLFLLVMTALTLIYPLILKKYSNPDFGPLITGYLGFILTGGAFLSLGLFASSLTSNQIVSAIITFGIGLLIWVIDAMSNFAGKITGSILSYLSFSRHFEDLARGVLTTKDVIFYLSFIVFFLFLTVRSVEARRY